MKYNEKQKQKASSIAMLPTKKYDNHDKSAIHLYCTCLLIFILARICHIFHCYIIIELNSSFNNREGKEEEKRSVKFVWK